MREHSQLMAAFLLESKLAGSITILMSDDLSDWLVRNFVSLECSSISHIAIKERTFDAVLEYELDGS